MQSFFFSWLRDLHPLLQAPLRSFKMLPVVLHKDAPRAPLSGEIKNWEILSFSYFPSFPYNRLERNRAPYICCPPFSKTSNPRWFVPKLWSRGHLFPHPVFFLSRPFSVCVLPFPEQPLPPFLAPLILLCYPMFIFNLIHRSVHSCYEGLFFFLNSVSSP